MQRKKKPVFVIQQHAASSMHYDFRIEVEGVLKSWAVPKGLSTDPEDKRLAIPTEDHELEHAEFEGVIPDGESGAGPVIIWDRGWFENVTEKDGETLGIDKALDAGHAVIRLHGEKLSGEYALQRFRNSGDPQWLIIKTDDGDADARRNPVSTEPESVVSGKTVEELSDDNSSS